MTGPFQFGLTDDTGLPDKGTVYSDGAFTLNVLLAGDTEPAATFGGISNLPGAGVMFLSNGVTPRTPLQFGQQLSHEIGHNFGLFHAFDPRSCLRVAQGTSDRAMDYSADMSVFVDCERSIAVDTAQNVFGLAPVDHDASVSLDFQLFDGTWVGQRVIGSPGVGSRLSPGAVPLSPGNRRPRRGPGSRRGGPHRRGTSPRPGCGAHGFRPMGQVAQPLRHLPRWEGRPHE